MIKTVILDITVVPKSSRSEIRLTENNNIKVYLNSPPADGKANAELNKIFGKKFKIPKSSIKILKGEKSRKKRIEIEGLSIEEVLKLLKKADSP